MRNGITLLVILGFTFAFGQVPDRSIGHHYDVQKPSRTESDIWTSVFQEKGKFGAKVNDKVVLEPIYEKINSGHKGFLVKKDGKFGSINYDNQLIIAFKFDSLYYDYSGQNYVSILKNKRGLIDLEGKEILAPKFDKFLYNNGNNKFAIAVLKDENIVFYSGKEIKHKLENLIFYANGLSASVNGKFGWIQDGQVNIPFEYESLENRKTNIYPKQNSGNEQGKPFRSENQIIHYLTASKNGKFGVLDVEGKVVVPIEYNSISFDSQRGIFEITDENKLKGIYITSSKFFLKPKYNSIYTDGTKFINLALNGKFGLINYKGEEIFPIEYDKAFMESSNGFLVQKNKKFGWVSTDGKVLVPIIYDKLDNFYGEKSGFTKAQIGSLFGIIRIHDNHLIIPVEFDQIYEYFGQNFLVEKNKKQGLINTDGKIVAEIDFEFIKRSNTENSPILYPFRNGFYSLVDKNGNLKFKDEIKSFHYILDDNYQIQAFASDYPQIKVENSKGKFGVLNEKTGEISIPTVYDEIYQNLEGQKSSYYIVQKGKKWGVVNHVNETILPFDYESIDFYNAHYNFEDEKNVSFVAKKGGKFGAINLKKQVLIPFEYKELAKISRSGLFKAKKNSTYSILNSKNQKITEKEFDEVSNFEFYDPHHEDSRAMTFKNGEMVVINENGDAISTPIQMNSHQGFAIFDDLKKELIRVLDSEDDSELLTFVEKVAPSEHIKYIFQNISSEMKSDFQYLSIEYERQKYYEGLLNFKHTYWKIEDPNYGYIRKYLEEVTDFTIYNDGILIVRRAENLDYGNRFLEKFLRHSIKVNGFWISSYFAY